MNRKFLLTVLLSAGIPILAACVLIYRTAIGKAQSDIVKALTLETEYKSKEIAGYLEQKKKTVHLLAGLGMFSVAVEYQRFEGLTRFFDSLMKNERDYFGVCFLNKDLNIQAHNDVSNDGLYLNDHREQLARYAAVIDFDRDSSWQFVEMDSSLTPVLVAKVFDKFSEHAGYLVVLLNQAYIHELLSGFAEKYEQLSGGGLKYLAAVEGGRLVQSPGFHFDHGSNQDLVTVTNVPGDSGGIRVYFQADESMLFSRLRRARLIFWAALPLVAVFIGVLTGFARREARLSALGQLASQVAHDIRSPLAALDSVAGSTANLPEEKRIIIRSAISRIRDIANNLVEKKGAPAKPAEAPSLELLSGLIEPLITEKRLQFRSKIGIEIEGALDVSSYGLFARLQANEFKRVLSNLINNSVEAMGDKGKATVSLIPKGDRIWLQIQDNGKGISSEVLAKIGRRGQTFGKVGGSGLGLYHAKTKIESWGGRLQIASEVGQSTIVTMELPAAPPPEWFVSRLELGRGGPVVILDDDSSIHQVWQSRFDSQETGAKLMEVVHCSIPQELRSWVQENPIKAAGALYLLDYELIGHRETGLDLIGELQIADRSLLVTSRYEEKKILAECERLKVRLIPKNLVGFVPINKVKAACDAVLIDDDPLVRMTWTTTARSSGVVLEAFPSPKDFLAAGLDLSPETPIFLDCELGNGERGEDFAKELHVRGFMALYLATGHSPERFVQMNWIRAVVGKEPPFSNN